MHHQLTRFIAFASLVASLVGCGCAGNERQTELATAEIPAGETTVEIPLTLLIDDPDEGSFELFVGREACDLADPIQISLRREDGSVIRSTGACGFRTVIWEELGERAELRVVLTLDEPATEAQSHVVSVQTFTPICAGESATRIESFGA